MESGGPVYHHVSECCVEPLSAEEDHVTRLKAPELVLMTSSVTRFLTCSYSPFLSVGGRDL